MTETFLVSRLGGSLYRGLRVKVWRLEGRLKDKQMGEEYYSQQEIERLGWPGEVARLP